MQSFAARISQIDGVEWIRLHYTYPDQFDDELIDEIASNPKIVKYLDIPIQHINNKILKTMNRHGTGDDIRALFKTLRRRIPGFLLLTSLIALVCPARARMSLRSCAASCWRPRSNAPAFSPSPRRRAPRQRKWSMFRLRRLSAAQTSSWIFRRA